MNDLSPIASQILDVMTERRTLNATLLRHLLHGIDDLDRSYDSTTPGNAAMRELLDAGLVEPMPGMPTWYRMARVARKD